MFSSALLLFSLASICQYVMPYRSISFDTKVVQPTEKVSNVLLLNTISGNIFCGGNVINSIYILTAAECVVGRHHDDIIVFIGCQRLQHLHFKNAFPVREIIIHEKYEPRDPWLYNIALLRLYFGISFSSSFYYVRPVPIPDNDTIRELSWYGSGLPFQLRARVFGHGILSEKSVPTYKMMKSNTTIIKLKTCKKFFNNQNIYFNKFNISESQICARDPTQPSTYDARISDVGGPLIFRSQVVGIALSATPENYSDLYLQRKTFRLYIPVVFTNVVSYREWINVQIKFRQKSDESLAHAYSLHTLV